MLLPGIRRGFMSNNESFLHCATRLFGRAVGWEAPETEDNFIQGSPACGHSHGGDMERLGLVA